MKRFCLVAAISLLAVGGLLRFKLVARASPQEAREARTVSESTVPRLVVGGSENATYTENAESSFDAETDAAEVNRELPTDLPPPMQIQIWWGVGGHLGEAFEKQVARFNESHERVVVKIRSLAGYGGVYRELKKAFETGDLPDAAVVEIHQIASFAAENQIKPLDGFIKDDQAFQGDDLLAGMLTNLRYRDRLYALPLNRSTPILYYNKKRFAEAGLDPSKPPETWQQVREKSRALTSVDGNRYGFLPWNSPWIFESMVWSGGGEWMVGKKATFAEPGAKSLQLWADMVHRDKTARYGLDPISEFTEGRAAMVIESTAWVQWLASECGFELGTAFLPSFEGFKHAVPTGGGAAVIPTAISAERQAAAWAFLTWFISTTQAAEWSRTMGYIPVRESARTLLRTEGFYHDHPAFETAIEQMEYAREAPMLQRWPAAWKIIADAMNSIVGNDASAVETLKSAEEKVDVLLNAETDQQP